jgi:hypothetical protein
VLATDPMAGKRTDGDMEAALDSDRNLFCLSERRRSWHLSTPRSSPIGSSDALSESGIATLLRLRGRRRVERFAGSIGSSNLAFRGIKPDPATAIQAVTGSGMYDGHAESDRSLNSFSFRNSPTRDDPPSARNRILAGASPVGGTGLEAVTSCL